MRKSVLVALAVLAMPLASFGYNLDLLVGGAASIDFNPAVDTEILVDVVTDVATDGVNFNIVVDNGASDGIWGMGAPGLTAYGVYGASDRWFATYDVAADTDLATLNTMGNEIYFKGAGQAAAGTVATYRVVPVGTLTMGEVYEMSAGTDAYGWGNFFGGLEGGAPLIVNIVPEPATALLLLVALPFLRRRNG